MKDIFAVYKPKGPTSNKILQEIKRSSGAKKVGHAGTLDPLASGVLVVAIGREATKKLGEIVGKEKEYLATVRLGTISETDDSEGEKTKIDVKTIPRKKDIESFLPEFSGEIWQTPPIYSAIKIKGKEAYKLARKGKPVKLNPRKVIIKKIEILSYCWPYLRLRVITGPGVYIRALARDLGSRLKTGGYLAALERVRVGDFTKEKALTVEDFSKLPS